MLAEKFRTFFEAYFGNLPRADNKGEVCILNPFRQDSVPSLYLNLNTGQYNDFGAEFKGDAYTLYIEMHSVDYSRAREVISNYLAGEPLEVAPIAETLLEEWHNELMSDLPRRAYLTQERGLSMDTIKQFKIGWYQHRYTIPVRNKYGLCINVRRYDPESTGRNKMISFADGYGMSQLFPIHVLEQNEAIIFHEGEWDALLSISKGYNAITSTAGAKAWRSEWAELFIDKVVYLCFDADNTGEEATYKMAMQLRDVAKEVKIIRLPLEGTKSDKDISDYYVKRGFTPENFSELLLNAEPYAQPTNNPALNSLPVQRVPLAEARSSRFKHSRISFDVQVIGKNTAPYNIPNLGTFKCSSGDPNKKGCAHCAVFQASGELQLKVPTNPNVLELIKTTKSAQASFLKSLVNIPTSCHLFTYSELKSTNIEEILIAPEIPEFHAWNGESSEYLVQTAYFADKVIESNRSYRMEGIMTPDPWQQHVTFVLDKCEPLQDTVESFKMTPEVFKQLEIFQSDDCKAKFADIHKDLSANITHIVGRGDLLTGIDLTFHSALGFTFQNVPVQKGWLEFLCIGDTRTGKSETTEAILRHYKLGEISVAENTSYAGLVGGLQQTGDKRWFLTWGKLPLNDSRLFVIDEASGLSYDDIAKMSGIRSSGIAEITKIQTERTTSRTRLIWLSNPRSGNSLSTYGHGILAVPELIGKAEDISRFDFVVSAAKDEVPINEINKLHTHDDVVPHKYTGELCRLLILWAWSRTPEQIIFTPEATKAILNNATKMGTIYSSQIPLVEGANHRIKLARMAVAAAARLFSTDASGECVMVRENHVQFACDYLNEIYNKPSLNYKGYSAAEFLDTSAAKKNRPHVLAFLNSNVRLGDLCARQDFMWSRTLEEQLHVERSTATELISFLVRNRMIKDNGPKGYKKTAGFIAILRDWENTQMEKEMQAEIDNTDYGE